MVRSILTDKNFMPRLNPVSQEAYCLLVPAYKKLMQAVFVDSHVQKEIELLPDRIIDIFLIGALGRTEWLRYERQIAVAEYKPLAAKVVARIPQKPELNLRVRGYIRDVRRRYPDFIFSFLLGQEAPEPVPDFPPEILVPAFRQ